MMTRCKLNGSGRNSNTRRMRERTDDVRSAIPGLERSTTRSVICEKPNCEARAPQRLGLSQANWQAIAMRQPIHLTFEAVVALLARTFEKLPDKRDPARVKYPLRDSSLSAF